MSDRTDRQVVLVIPRMLVGIADEDRFGELIDEGSAGVRCIVRADKEAELRYAEIARDKGLDVEVLWCSGEAPRRDGVLIAAMLPGATCDDADLFAMAMSDALLLPRRDAPGTADDDGVRSFCADLKKRSNRRDLSKRAVASIGARPAAMRMPRGSRLPRLGQPGPEIVEGPKGACRDLTALDPRVAQSWWGRSLARLMEWTSGRVDGWMTRQACRFGRLIPGKSHSEASDLTLDDFDTGLPKVADAGPAPDPDSPDRHCQAYFGPEEWTRLVPDGKRGGPYRSALLGYFRVLDRSALLGSWVQRDIVWITHLSAAFAVFSAVAGLLHLLESHHWPLIELGLILLALAPVVIAQLLHLQRRWMACRLAAEQIRIGYMCLAVMVLPPVLLLPDERPGSHPSPKGSAEYYRDQAVAMAKRLLRNYGLPQTDGTDLARSIRWVRAMVRDQFGYHRSNYQRLIASEHGLHCLVGLISIIVGIAVISHVALSQHWLDGVIRLPPEKLWIVEVISAVGPALAAAFHGIGTRLDMAHRGDLSRDTLTRLYELDRALAALDPTDAVRAGDEFRDLAVSAAEAMNTETEQWHRLSLLQQLTPTV